MTAFLAVLWLISSDSWVRIVTPRFDVVSSAGERRTRELVRDLETLAAAIPIHGVQPPSTRVYLFARRAEVQPYFDLLMKREKVNVVGTFVGQSGRATMFIDDSRSHLHDRTAYHELVHYLMGTSASRAPLWLEEGLAEYYSSAEVHGGIIKVGAPIREHIALLKRKKIIPVAELFRVTGGTDTAISTTFYAESWAIVDWMIAQDRNAFDALLRDVTDGVASDVALQKRFRKSPSDLESLLTSVPELPMTLQVRVPEIEAAATPLSRADVLYELGVFLSKIDSAKNESEQHFRAAVEADPKHPRALAELELQKAEREHSRELAQKALAMGADRARALDVIGTIAALEEAVALAPDRPDFAQHLHNAREAALAAELERINALVKAQKLDEAASLTRTLAANTKDAHARQQLEVQASQLEHDAATNREIGAYNDAVQLFNARDYGAALKIVDELLKSAKDPQVISDATKMRGMIRAKH